VDGLRRPGSVKTLMRMSAVVACLVASRAGAQKPPGDTSSAPAKPVNYAYRYRLLGVFDTATGEPVEGVEVSDVLTGTKALTTKTGTVSLMFLPDGGSLVRIRKVGYEMLTLTVAISPADTAPVTVLLGHATTLEPVVVKDTAEKYIGGGLRSFEEHMRQGFGHFVTEDEFRKDDGKPLANILLGHIPGIMRTNGPHGESYIVSSRKPCAGPALRGCRQPDCYVSVIQDGVTLYEAGAQMQPLDYAKMDGLELAAAEYYAGGAASPPEYNKTSNGCGVLVLWTRER
jgi:hypothetical protein